MIQRLSVKSSAEYHAHKAVGRSDLKRAWDEPELYFLESLLEPASKRLTRSIGDKDAIEFGCDVEAMLRGDALDVVEIPEDVLAKNGARSTKAWYEFEAANAGKRLLRASEVVELEQKLEYVRRSIRRHDEASYLLGHTDIEWNPRYTWTDESGLALKCELDVLIESEDLVIDIKTARHTRRELFLKQTIDLGYDVQAAQYTHARERLTGYPHAFVWLVIRNCPPYNVEIYEATYELLLYGERRRQQWIANYNRCLASGRWCSETHGQIVPLGLPSWARFQLREEGIEV